MVALADITSTVLQTWLHSLALISHRPLCYTCTSFHDLMRTSLLCFCCVCFWGTYKAHSSLGTCTCNDCQGRLELRVYLLCSCARRPATVSASPSMPSRAPRTSKHVACTGRLGGSDGYSCLAT
jgi:hypothetical protein